MHNSLNLSLSKENLSLFFLNAKSDTLWSLAEACNTLANIIAPVHLMFTVVYKFFIGKDLTAAEKLKKAPQIPPILNNSIAQ